MILEPLSDEAIVSARFQCACSVGFPVSDKKATELARYVARKAKQEILRQVVEWLSQDCTKHDHNGEYMWRRRCWECWRELKKLAEEEG